MSSKPPEIQSFDDIGNNYREWVFTADELLTANRFLCEHSYHLSPDWGSMDEHPPTFDELRITGVILMLRAMAVECLLKALWLKSGEQLASDGKYRSIPGTKDHDLITLADKVSKKIPLVFSADESDFIRRLSRNIVSGRYPIHKDWQVNSMPRAGGDRRHLPGIAFPDHDDDLFAAVVSKLRHPFEDDLKEMYSGLEDEDEE